MEFMHCYTGEVGSIHDALLLRRSSIMNKIDSGLINFDTLTCYNTIYKLIIIGEFNINADQHLLGDSAYPLKNWLII